ncbi:MAG: glycosyltransferase family 39 protein [Snowella sp.]|nr:glycosyltransferase family 39 protein [Snowella sp.]
MVKSRDPLTKSPLFYAQYHLTSPKTAAYYLSLFLPLALWILIGIVLRFNELTSKSPWTDEFATLVFSLGNHFNLLPLNQIISAETLLNPLQPNVNASAHDVANLLLNEDNHPPLYFVFFHLWLKLFPSSGDYINLWASRAFPALFGVLAIPVAYLVGKIVFRSVVIANLAALVMAVSPYHIFLSQEARHYTCAVLVVCFALGCFLKAAQTLSQGKTLSKKLIFTWIMINAIGLSIHFFVGLGVLATFLSLGVLFIHQAQTVQFNGLKLKHWNSLLIVLLGSFTTVLVWVSIITQREFGNGMTQWIQQDNSSFIGLVSPPFQLIAAWVTMLCLLPIESSSLAIALFSGVIMLVYLIWFIPIIKQGLTNSWNRGRYQLETKMLILSFISLIILFLGVTYLGGKDITRGARYSFVYLPTVTFLLAIVLANYWHHKSTKFKLNINTQNFIYFVKNNGKTIAFLVGLMGILSGLSITHNLGYRKYYDPTQFLKVVQSHSTVPALIATTHQSLVQTGEMMGLAWALKHHSAIAPNPTFLLIHQTEENSPETTQKLKEILEKETKPLDVWAVNFHAPVNLPQCVVDNQAFPAINGYGYQHYHCDSTVQ